MALRRATSITLAVVSLAAASACTPGAKPVTVLAPSTTAASASGSATPSATASASASAPAPAAVSSLSGLPGTQGKPVIAVKIDNTAGGRPQTGLNQADIVYVEEVEGGLSRVMAVFQSTMPPRVGPVRSARESDLEILAAYGKVALAYAGAQPAVNALVLSSPQVAANEDNGNFLFRDWSRPAPYNLYLDPAKLLRARPNIATANDIGVHFTPTLTGGAPARSVTAAISGSVTIGFTYDRPHHRWIASQNGSPTILSDGSRVWTTNVLVQEVTVVASRFHDVNHNNTPLSHTVGSGHFRAFRPDGRMFTGTWTRTSKNAPTVYRDAQGHEVTFAPGRTWILLVPKGNSVRTQ
jgi:hypothetical protein